MNKIPLSAATATDLVSGEELVRVPDSEGGEGDVVPSPGLALPPHAGVRFGDADCRNLSETAASLLCKLLQGQL